VASAELIRVVVVSPGDVQDERDRVAQVVEELNRRVADERGCRLSLWRWETDTHPGLHLEGPQGLIDDAMCIVEADLVIGIFWTRFGTPTHDAQSGTEHELGLAWSAWREHGRPQVAVYFCERESRAQNAAEAEQLHRLLAFREAMPKHQLWWTFKEAVEFERAVRAQLTAFVLDRPPAGVAPAGRRALRVNMPLAPAYFTGRDDELAAIDEALRVADRAVVTQAIGGLGGIGKSQLAARYAHLHAGEYAIVAWIGAEDGGAKDLARLAGELETLDAELTIDQRAERALRWLSACDERWLLVLDNLASPGQLAGCCPSAGNGRVLVTTRDHAISQFAPVLTLKVFDEKTAVDYLVDRAGENGDRAAALRVARALGCLPLALSHAAAYCAAGTGLDDYLALLDALPAAEVFARAPEVFYRDTVASTWQLSMRAAAAEAELAGDVLAMASLLAPDDIPRKLFAALVDGDDPHQRKALIDACAALQRFSLATVTPQTLGVHRLLQRVVREGGVASDERIRRAALRALDDALPGDPEQPSLWPAYEAVAPHVLALGEALEHPHGDESALIDLLNGVSSYLLRAGGVQRAVDATTSTRAHALRLLGLEHRLTLRADANLAFAFWSAGRTREAIEIEERVLAHRERVLGVEHPGTLVARANLASSYWSAGRTGEAIELFERVLADRERVHGADHPRTLMARGNLAMAYWSAGRTGEAIELGERVLADRERILGAEHPGTLTARGNLAMAYWSAGRTAEAIELEERVLADRERVLGAEHPDTLLARANLASSYRSAGRTADAIGMLEQVLVDMERILGTEHPTTSTIRANLDAIRGGAAPG
jgi:tetratricopeptide (TPR) repeat protein